MIDIYEIVKIYRRTAELRFININSTIFRLSYLSTITHKIVSSSIQIISSESFKGRQIQTTTNGAWDL